MKKGYVYILQSKRNGQYYIGSSTDPHKRLKDHNQGLVKSTKYKGSWRLIFTQAYPDVTSAKIIEYRLKKMKSRNIIDKILSKGTITLVI